MKKTLIAVPKSLAIISKGRRRNRRIAKAWMTIEHRGCANRNIVSGSPQSHHEIPAGRSLKRKVEGAAGNMRRASDESKPCS